MEAWDYTPSITRYHYFLNKPQFELPVNKQKEWTVFIMEQGECSYRIGESGGMAGPGSFLLCPPHVFFHRSTIHPLTFHFLVFNWLNQSGEPLPPSLYPQETKWTVSNTSRLHSTLALMRDPPAVTGSLLARWRSHLFLDLLRLHWTEQAAPGLAHFHDPLMDKAREVIGQTYAEPCRVRELAVSLNLSHVQFARRFQRAYGLNPSEYIRRLQLQRACRLLTHTPLTLEEIARESGFSNGFYLSRVFSEKMHKSPSQYRAEHRV
jgi:AraC-like DNA-binding protein